MINAAYVLVTPARNEEQYIEKTLQAVVAQTILPLKWVIISDGSTDRTDEIVSRYAAGNPFIHLVRRAPGGTRNFASKVYSIRAGVECLEDLAYEFIGITDADIALDPDFFEKVIAKMQSDPGQGIGGGIICEQDDTGWCPMKNSTAWSVGGPVQMFRRKCWEDIGGYMPLARGGVDMIAEIMARMHGWKVRTFQDLMVYHYRTTGTASGNKLRSFFRRGVFEYVNGYHPAFQAMRFFSWMPIRPFFIASLLRTAGYFWALLRREPFAVPEEVVRFLRKEQLRRLQDMLHPGKGASA